MYGDSGDRSETPEKPDEIAGSNPVFVRFYPLRDESEYWSGSGNQSSMKSLAFSAIFENHPRPGRAFRSV